MNPELQTTLTKAVYAYKVRDILTMFGFSEDTPVTLELMLGESTEPVARVEVATSEKKEHVPCGTISMMSLQQMVLDDFINPALHNLDLGQHIPDSDGKIASGESKLNICFRSNTNSFSSEIALAGYCCIPCGGICCRFCA